MSFYSTHHRWLMDQEYQKASARNGIATQVWERCACSPISLLHDDARLTHGEVEIDYSQIVPASTMLNQRLHSALAELFLCSARFSVLLFHVVQIEQTVECTQDDVAGRCFHYHVHAGIIEQILANVRRVLRSADQLLMYEQSGAVLLLPDVDRWGAEAILERVYQSVALLQAQTLIPPLTFETTITIGAGSYPDPAASPEALLQHTGIVARALTLRPVVSTLYTQGCCVHAPCTEVCSELDHIPRPASYAQAPFMTLPRRLAKRLTQLVPYAVALRLRCVPVGRDQHRLTVAMSNPFDSEQVQQLCELTGMNIFPVSCKEEDLNALLEKKW